MRQLRLLEEWWKKHNDDRIHAYYCVLAKDHEDAFITVIKHSSEIDAWIAENVKELGWKRIYGLSSCRLKDTSTLVTFNRDFPMYRIYFCIRRITNPIVDIPIAKPGRSNCFDKQSEHRKEIKLVLERPSKKEPEQAPDFGTELPEGVTAANFHQNLFKPITTASKRKKAAKGQATKSQAIGISSMFQSQITSRTFSHQGH